MEERDQEGIREQAITVITPARCSAGGRRVSSRSSPCTTGRRCGNTGSIARTTSSCTGWSPAAEERLRQLIGENYEQ